MRLEHIFIIWSCTRTKGEVRIKGEVSRDPSLPLPTTPHPLHAHTPSTFPTARSKAVFLHLCVCVFLYSICVVLICYSSLFLFCFASGGLCFVIVVLPGYCILTYNYNVYIMIKNDNPNEVGCACVQYG